MQLLDPALSHYRDRRFPGTQEQFEQRLQESTTLYIGNLSFFTTEEQVYEVGNVSSSLLHSLPSLTQTQGRGPTDRDSSQGTAIRHVSPG